MKIRITDLLRDEPDDNDDDAPIRRTATMRAVHHSPPRSVFENPDMEHALAGIEARLALPMEPRRQNDGKNEAGERTCQ